MLSKVIIALALFAAPTSAEIYSELPSVQKYLWESFKAEFNKEYASDDEQTYFNVFIDNLKLIDARNNAKGTAIHGITKFCDMTPSEFKKTHLNYVPNPNRKRTFVDIQPLPEGTDALVDWTGKYTTPVKDQGYCGSCWAFSATEQIESDYMRTSGKSQILSAQQVTSCAYPSGSGGCNGGFTEDAFDYAKGGLETDTDYPYNSQTSGGSATACESVSSKFVVKTTGYTTVSSSASGESAMASYVGSTGPLSVCVDAESWNTYTGGILTASECGTSVDHCVQAVGIDTAAGYWKVRNSWGTSWGESGFIRLSYGENTCAVASDANYASTAAVVAGDDDSSGDDGGGDDHGSDDHGNDDYGDDDYGGDDYFYGDDYYGYDDNGGYYYYYYYYY